MKTSERSRTRAFYALRALLCLCLSLGAQFDAFDDVPLPSGEEGSRKFKAGSTNPASRGTTKSVVMCVNVSLHGAIRTKQTPLHPANLPPERVIVFSTGLSYFLLNPFANRHSLTFRSLLQERAPPRLA